MKKLVLTSLAFLLLIGLYASSPKYSRVKIFTDQTGLLRIMQAGISLDNASAKQGVFVIAEISADELQMISTLGFEYEMLIHDMTEFYTSRNSLPESNKEIDDDRSATYNYPVPPGFTLGTHGGFCSYIEYLAHLDNLAAMYPNLITQKQPVSSTLVTIENRPVYMVRISNNPNTYQEDKPKVLYTGMIHAREAIGMQHQLFFMYYILDKYSSDPAIQYLVDNAELYFVPMVNPDGYLYNQQTDPNGGGMWRKNRRLNTGGSYGIDLNRNFGYMWGYDNVGSSPTPSSETYRGTGPFSEPETAMLQELCQTIPFSIALNYHSYSNLLLYPWGYIADATPDDAIFETFSIHMTADNNYTYGIGSTTIYATNGGSDDWMYGEQFTKGKIFSYTPEVGSSSDGFWPATNRIIPLCQENMLQSLLAGYFTLHYGILKPKGDMIISETQGHVGFDLQRLGLQDGGTFTVSISSDSPWVLSVGSPLEFTDLNLLEAITDSVSFSLIPSIAYGTPVKFVLSLNNGFYTKSDTVTKIYGVPEVLFYDDCNTLTNWTGNWGISTTSYISPTASITDSPTGNYSNNTNKSVTTTNFINMGDAVFARMSFWAKWNIEAGYDYVQVKVSTNGSTWTPLAGKYTKPGSSNQLQGQPLYDGVQSAWVQEEIDLSAYLGQNIKIRFTLVSDGGVTADGYYFDDLSITVIHASEALAAYFVSDGNTILEGSQVQFTDLSSGNIQTWDWSFAGGQPASSNVQHPLVTYTNPGAFDVILTISDGTNNSTYGQADYIIVLDSILCKPDVFAGRDSTILNTLVYQIPDASASNYSSLLWTTNGDGVFNDATVINPIYTPGSQDIANLQAILYLTAEATYDICDDVTDFLVLGLTDPMAVETFDRSKIKLFPNPSGGIFHVTFASDDVVTLIEVLNLTGVVVYKQQLDGNNESNVLMNLTGNQAGLYFIRLTTMQGVRVTKMIISR